ncbi:MAG: ABC transporter ATP-binding protein [Firmicutes bacterium]|nr:ABC transporter ATP-binding protein [Bacillota bacterium]
MIILEGRGLVRHYRQGSRSIRAVDGVDLAVREHEALGLVGESGSGKSTLLRLLLGLERPDSGELYFRGRIMNGRDGKQRNQFRREVQAVFQEAAASLNPRLTVKKIIAEPLQNLKPEFDSRRRLEEVNRILLEMGMQHGDRRRYPHEFSGGQQRRIALARALVADPVLVLCDEATSGLDLSVQARLLNLLLDLRESRRAGFLFVTHDLAAVRYLCTRVAVIYGGQIIEELPAAGLQEPLHPYTQALLAAEPSLFGAAAAPLLTGEPPDPAAFPPGCRFHPRCPVMMERCREEKPRLTGVAPGWRVACFRVNGSCSTGKGQE